MTRTFMLAAALAIAATACERRHAADSRAVMSSAMSGVLAFPQSTPLSMTAGTDAGQMIFTTVAPLDTVAAWYRQVLPLNGWELQSDAKGADGSISLYAQKGSKPLWITLKSNVGGPGTTYTLIGAAVDTSAADSTAGKSSRRH